MDFKTFFIKKILISFFITVTCISLGMAITGLIFDPNAQFGYEAYFYPIVYGFVSMLPSLLMYSKTELSIKQMFLRNVVSFILIEIIILAILYFGGALSEINTGVSIALTVLVIYLTVNLVLWMNDKKTANALTSALKELQKREEKDKMNK